MKKLINIAAVILLVFYGVATLSGFIVEHINNLSIENFINNTILPLASHPLTLVVAIIIGLLYRYYIKGKKVIGVLLIVYCGLILLSLIFGTWFANAISGHY